MLNNILLTAMLSTLSGDIASTCINIAHGQREHFPLAPHGCTAIAAQSGAGIAGAILLIERNNTPTWARVLIYGGLAGAHGYAMAHNLRKAK